ncbi:MAG: glutaredoxin family protein [Candidatus Obscuribacterales bacterium]|nr:glutaredoxin family protein [Candidatus Obscuribacterales bacterium]
MTVTLFVVPNCPLCQNMKEILQRHDVSFSERDVSSDYSALRTMFKLTRQKLVPVVECAGQTLVRPTEQDVLTLLQNRSN